MYKNLIHVGYPKTATTWFQNSFYPFVSNFHFLERELIKQEIIFQHALHKNSKLIAISDSEKNILCEEMLIGSIQNGGLHGFLTEKSAYRLRELVPNAEVILFIRNQHELVYSSYLQYLRTGGNLSLRRFLFPARRLNATNQFNEFDFRFFEFDRIIDFYKSVFGPEKVHVFLYEEFREDPLKFISEFSRHFGFKVDINQVDFSVRKAGFPFFLIPIIRVLNAFTSRSILNKYYFLNIPGMYGFVKRIIHTFSSGFFGSEIYRGKLSKKTNLYISQFYSPSNNRLVNILKKEKLLKYNYPL